MGQRHADEQRRYQDDEAGDRTGDADVEQRALARERFADADHRTEGAGQKRRRGGRKNGRLASTA
jgi:hypothetical protein